MASKTHTLTIGGVPVEVPEWASEQTMRTISGYMSQSAKTDTVFAKLIKGIGGDVGSLQEEIAGLVGATKQDIRADDISDTEQEKFTKKLTNASSKLDKAMGFFGKHETPLSAMTDGLSSLAKGSKNAEGGFKMFEGLSKSVGATGQVAGAALNVAADALLAYAGWNAAKLEQFAKVQSKMVESGIIFSGGAKDYDTLRKGIQSTGNTYLHLSETLGTFSDGMLGLGSTVTEGALEFSKFYQALNKSAESLGDLGMSSKDMMTAYGEFISYQRRTGQLNKKLNRSADDVNSTFIEMQIEAGAIANLTSLSRSEAMRAKMEAMDTYGSAANRILIERGFPERAAVQKEIAEGLGIVAKQSPAIQAILDAFNYESNLAARAVNPGDFDLSMILQDMSPGMETKMNLLVPNLVENIDKMMQSGTAPTEGMLTWLLTQINGADQSKLTAAAAAGDRFAQGLLDAQVELMEVTRNFGNLANGEKLKNVVDNQKKDIAEAGKTTQAMNEMTEKFILVQEALTLDMENTAKMFDGLKYGLEAGKKQIDKMLNLVGLGGELNDFGGAGGDTEMLAEAMSGIVSSISVNSIEKVSPAGNKGDIVGVDENSTAGKAVIAMRENENVITKEMLEELGITSLHNMEGAVAHLMSLAPGFREKAVALIANYNDEMKGTDQKLVITSGRIEKENEDDPDTYQSIGAQATYAILDSNGKVTSDAATTMGEGSAFKRAAIAAGLYNNQNAAGMSTPNKNYGVVGPNNDNVSIQKVDKKWYKWDYDDNADTAKDSSSNEGVEIQNKDKKKVTQYAPRKKAGGPVTAGQPYIVGDQLGMDTAELFVPHSSGNIVNNTELNKAVAPSTNNEFITGIKEMQLNLTNIQESVTMNNSQDLSELLASKQSVVETVKIMQRIIKQLNNSEKSKTVTNIMNSR